MKVSTLTAAIFAGAATLSGATAQAAFTDWQNEYTGNEPNTIALFNFNQGAELANSAAATSGSHNLTVVAPATTGAAGKFGRGLDVPRTRYASSTDLDGYAEASGVSLFPAGADPSLTVEMWVRFDNLFLGGGVEGQFHLIDKRGSQTVRGFDMSKGSTDNLSFRVGNGSEMMTVTAPIAGVLTQGTEAQWHHVAATWNAASDELKLFIDGVERGAAKYESASIVNATNQLLWIGQRRSTIARSMDGQIDGVRISSVAYDFAPIPEPASLALLGTGAALMFGRRR